MIFQQKDRLISLLVLLSGISLLSISAFFSAQLVQAESEPPLIIVHQNLDSPSYISAFDNIPDNTNSGSSQTVSRRYAVIDSQDTCSHDAFDDNQSMDYEKGSYIETAADTGKIYCFKIGVTAGGDTYDIYKASQPIGSINISFTQENRGTEAEPGLGFISAQLSGLEDPDIKYMFIDATLPLACNHDRLTEAHRQPQSETLLYNVTGRLVDYEADQKITFKPQHLNTAVCFIAKEESEFFYKKSKKITFEAITISETVTKIEEQNSGYKFTAEDTYDDERQPTAWLYKFITDDETCDSQTISEGGLAYKENEPLELKMNDHAYNNMRICFRSTPKINGSSSALYAQTSPIRIIEPSGQETGASATGQDSRDSLGNLLITLAWIVGLVLIFGLIYFYIKKVRTKRV